MAASGSPRSGIDCGDDDIVPVAGDEVDCLLTDPTTGQEYDATVVFTSADGERWNIRLEVDGAADDGAPEAPADPADGATADQSASDEAGLEVPGDTLAEAAADAIESETGTRPEIDCGEVNFTINEGRSYFCDRIDPATGSEYQVTITVTSIEGRQFEFDVQVADTPR